MKHTKRQLTIAIVGRPNVGKSTLFNRLVGRRQAIVEDKPGVTVDRHYGEAQFYRCRYTLIDTGGFEPVAENDLLVKMRAQATIAIEEADIVFFLLDVRDGLLASDEMVDGMLRKTEKPVYYVVNKVDGPRHEEGTYDFYRLGMDKLYSISAEHGVGVDELLTDVEEFYPSHRVRDNEKKADELRIALVGRPNAGKSTLVNRFLGEERHIVTDIPGTTRDAIDSVFTYHGKQIRLIDTAGIRRQKKISEVMEKRTMVKALKALDRADVALILLDAALGIHEQDAKIAAFAHNKGVPSVVLVNKWDAVKNKDNSTHGEFIDKVRDTLNFMTYTPILTISALEGTRVSKIIDKAQTVYDESRKRIPTAELNRWLKEVFTRHPPPIRSGRRLKAYYATQVEVSPPTFWISVNDKDRMHYSYERYLLNKLRDAFGFEGSPIRIYCRNRGRKEQGPAVDEM